MWVLYLLWLLLLLLLFILLQCFDTINIFIEYVYFPNGWRIFVSGALQWAVAWDPSRVVRVAQHGCIYFSFRKHIGTTFFHYLFKQFGLLTKPRGTSRLYESPGETGYYGRRWLARGCKLFFWIWVFNHGFLFTELIRREGASKSMFCAWAVFRWK